MSKVEPVSVEQVHGKAVEEINEILNSLDGWHSAARVVTECLNRLCNQKGFVVSIKVSSVLQGCAEPL